MSEHLPTGHFLQCTMLINVSNALLCVGVCVLSVSIVMLSHQTVVAIVAVAVVAVS